MGARGPKSAAEVMATAHRRRISATVHRDNPLDPPGHLQPATQAWWADIAPGLEPHQLRVLTCTCEAFDRKEAAREALAMHGLSYTDAKDMIRARPEVAIERDARAAFMRGLQQLKLDVDPPKPRRNGEGLGISWRDLPR